MRDLQNENALRDFLMRTDPIDPKDLRKHLVARVDAELKARAHSNDPTERQCHMLVVDALERVRHEYLQDFTPFDADMN